MLRLVIFSNSSELANEWISASTRLRNIEISWPSNASAEQLLESKHNFDGILIDAPRNQRCHLASLFAKAGWHVLLLSAPGGQRSEVELMFSQARQSGIQLMVLGTARYRPSLSEVKNVLDNGKLGTPALVRSHCWDSKDLSAEDWEERIIEQLDLATWLNGTHPVSIYATGANSPVKTLQVHLEFPENRMGLLVLACSLPTGESYQSCSVIGTTGAAYSDDHDQMQLIFHQPVPQAIKTSEGLMAHVEELKEFSRVLRENQPPTLSEDDCLQWIVLAEGVQNSLRLGQPLILKGGAYVPTP